VSAFGRVDDFRVEGSTCVLLVKSTCFNDRYSDCKAESASIERWRNYTDGITPKYSEKYPSQGYFAHYKRCIDWSGIEPVSGKRLATNRVSPWYGLLRLTAGNSIWTGRPPISSCRRTLFRSMSSVTSKVIRTSEGRAM
jgi:hypothetical protein